MTAPIASGWSKIAGWDLHPLRNAALTRRTPKLAVRERVTNDQLNPADDRWIASIVTCTNLIEGTA
jgi:hypothetical protein